MKHITLAQAHKIKTLSDAGVKQQVIADKLGITTRSVRNIITGKGLIKQRAIADRMEAFVGGVILGSGNLRAYAEPPCDDNDDGHAPRNAIHPLGDSWENEERVIPIVDTLTLLLAEENLIIKLQDAGIDADEVLLIDHESDVEEGSQQDQVTNPKRDDVHNETWEEFMARARADVKPGGNIDALVAKRLETEGAEVDVWAVRLRTEQHYPRPSEPFKGWPSQRWTPGLTNDTIYRKRTRS